MIEFAYPELFLLLPLPLLIFWLAPAYKAQKSSIKVPYFARLVDVTGETPQHGAVLLTRNTFQHILIVIFWCCLVTAMAKPESIGSPITQQKSARDLMIAVDLSGSMSVKDFTTDNGQVVDRLEAVKQVLSHFAEQRKHDRLGLILFGDAPYLQAPFTEDLNSWLTLLNESEIGFAGESTAFGDAIGLAIHVFEQSQTKNRVLIVLTDGNDNASRVPPIEAAKVAVNFNIKIYTIAIGDPTAIGEEKVDLEVLKSISKITDGKNFQALNSKELHQIYDDINEMEPEQFDSLSYRPRTSIHFYPILFGVIIYVLALTIVNIRDYHARRKRQHNTDTQGTF